MKVTCSLQNSIVTISVEDGGVGMSAQQVANLFQPFNRLGAECTAASGSGLGLVITKALVELMGGMLSVQSKAGVGTIMQVKLPCARSGSSVETPSASKTLPEISTHTVPRTVLYVEDNAVNALIMRQLFAAEPAWSLLIAETGAAGISSAALNCPDLILLDMQLPDMTGLEVFAALQAQKLIPTSGCIALSADALPSHVAAALQAGFTKYWTKPLELETTLDHLRKILAPEHR
ncbi:MAG: hypothetical protein JWM78_1466 [Verrucomicrobiaceae bacterium]|nr:hypothetical protein [Verrucomicrobiaceae bacterium]